MTIENSTTQSYKPSDLHLIKSQQNKSFIVGYSDY